VAANGGVSFGGRVAVATPFAVSSAKPSVAIGSSVKIHVAYNGNDAILYQRSSDGGASWSPAQALAAGVDTSVSPGLAVAATDVFVGYTRVSGGDSWVQFRESENDGNSWAAARQLAPKSANNTGSPVLDTRGHYIRAVFSRCLTNPCADDAIATVVRVDCCTLGARWGPPRRVSPTSHDRAIPIGVTGSQANVFGEQKTIVAWYRQDSGGAILQVWTRRDL
jgi:hypothetical protein